MLSLKTVILIPILATILLSVWISIYSPPPTDFGTGSMFDKIATRYDLVNRVLALNLDKSWRKTMVKEVFKNLNRNKKDPKILDLATGTADVAILLGQKIKKDNSILGIDPSQNMIDIGKSKVSSKKLNDKVTLKVGDARDLNHLKSSSFDAITMAFGIRNIPQRDVVLCEIHRLLKRKSHLYILEFSEPEGNSIMAMGAKLFIRYIVPILGAILSGAPKEYMHLQNSIKEFPSSMEFLKEIEGMECGNTGKGFRVEKVVNMNYGSVQLYVATTL